MQKANGATHGVNWGLIIGLVYCILLFVKYNFGSNNAAIFGLMTIVGYVVVLVLLLFCGLSLRKKNGGHIEMKEAFKTMFIAVLIFETFYAVFTFVYLKYIDPQFFEKLRLSSENLLISAGQPQAQIDKVLKDMDDLSVRSKELGIFDFLKSYLFYVGVTGLFALIYAFIIKRKPVFPAQENF